MSLAVATVVIDAPRPLVWALLVRQDTVPAIIPGMEVILGWHVGEPFLWTVEVAGRRSHIEGFVRRMVADHLLDYEYGDPQGHPVPDSDHLHHVTIELFDEGPSTRVIVTQESATQTAQAQAERSWRFALHNLKHLVELDQHLRTSLKRAR